MRLRFAVTLIGVLHIPFTTSHAQTCLGAASFSAGNMRLGAGVNVGDKSKSYGAQFALGAPKGPFATAGLSAVEYDEVSGNGVGFNVNAGYAVNTSPTSTAQFCPLVGFSYQSAPDIESEFGSITSSAHAFALGGALGTVASSGPGYDFVPFVSAAYVLSQASANVSGFSRTENNSYGQISVGAGLVLNRTLTIQPAATFPVGLEGGKATFGLSIGLNFGTMSK